MNEAQPTPPPFGQHLMALLAGAIPPRSQAWLARRSGLDRSTISRIVRGERAPNADTLALIAQTFGISLGDLVAGTDAEQRITAERDTVPWERHVDAVTHIGELELEVANAKRDAERAEADRQKEQRARIQAEQRLGELHALLEHANTDLSAGRARERDLAADLRLHVRALAEAVATIDELKGKLTELATATNDVKVSARIGAILAALAAAGALTATALLANEHTMREADNGST